MTNLSTAPMDNHQVTFEGHVDLQKYRYVYFFTIFILYIVILCCNFTILGLIVTQKNLHEPMYVLIAALLINSVLYSTVVHPKLLVDFLSEHQITTVTRCIFQATAYYIFSTSEFLLLSVMAYDRYVSICRPLQYQNIMRRSTIAIFLASAWFIPICQLAVMFTLYMKSEICYYTLKSILCNNVIYALQCVASAAISIYGVFILLNLVLLPVLFILFTYARILIVSYKCSRRVRTKAAQTCLPHLLVLINISTFITYDVIVVRMGANFPTLVTLILSLQGTSYHPLVNPFIYGLKMKEISKHLKRLLFQHKSQV